jgi:RNA polymerase sigma factor (sigma-70 family)
MVRTGALDLERLYLDHGHVVLRRARRILGNEIDAGEVLQEVFLSLVERPEQFAAKSAFTSFLYAVTTNACLVLLRNSRRRAALLDRELEPRTRHAGPAAEARVAATALLRRLPERLARVAVYYYVDEMTHEEIAELLGLSRRQIGNLISQVQDEARKGSEAA